MQQRLNNNPEKLNYYIVRKYFNNLIRTTGHQHKREKRNGSYYLSLKLTQNESLVHI